MALLRKLLRNEAGEDEGLADAGIKIFRDTTFAGLAHEGGQNSNDAARYYGWDGNAERVYVRIRKETIPTEAICNISGFRKTIDSCLNRARARRNDKEIHFFKRAKRIVSSPEMDLHHAIDDGVTGLGGPCDPDYCVLTKVKSISNRGDDTLGDPFGIDKSAAYAISFLRTVFDSTFYTDLSDTNQFPAWAKAILVSHKKHSREEHSATGYWGEAENFMPANSMSGLPEWFQRADEPNIRRQRA